MIDLNLLDRPHIYISLNKQRLELRQNNGCIRSFVISTAKKGSGEQINSECTPRGLHRIRAKIGSCAPTMSVFVGRRATGENYTPALSAEFPHRDWILTRILWLSGLEPGKNRFGAVDTAKRYIYIHGSPDHLVTGEANSHGCIRMKNTDVITLFDLVNTTTYVKIGGDQSASFNSEP